VAFQGQTIQQPWYRANALAKAELKLVFMRVIRDSEAARRFSQAKEMRLQKWHQERLGEMREHAKRSPWATAWLLERNFPELKRADREDVDSDYLFVERVKRRVIRALSSADSLAF
jgi:hypothetical protein